MKADRHVDWTAAQRGSSPAARSPQGEHGFGEDQATARQPRSGRSPRAPASWGSQSKTPG
jgi:hypothetical protein